METNNLDKKNNNDLLIKMVPVVVSSSNEYVPILSTCIESIKDNSSKEYLYEINILEHNITEDNKRILNTQFKNSNIKLNFINVKDKIAQLEKYVAESRFTINTFSRFFIPELLPYEKCVYVDLDTIVLDDIKILYDTNLEDNYLAASIDSSFIGCCACDKRYIEYAHNTLKIPDIENYFQAGVLVFNLQKMRENNIIRKCLNVLEDIQLHFADQCVYNYLFKNNVKYLELNWNYQFNDCDRQKIKLKQNLPLKILEQYNNAYKNPKIVHYSSKNKPWFYPSEEYAQIWWGYARKTPFYEQLLEGLTLRLIEQQKAVVDFWKNCLLYWLVKVLKCFSLGKVNKNLGKKQFELKEKIRLAKEIIKNKQ
ncbi:glycosyltransferase family 8 protein [bacterium]|nr:glycosyltransferase family 8 protein [bacterium]